jgi:hypothetical protein
MKTSWNKIEESLHDKKMQPETRDKESFWSDFRARVRLRSQDSTVSVRAPLIWKWSVATACAALVTAVVGFQLMHKPLTEATGPVKSLDVLAEHSAVIMMNDEASDATVIWVADMKIDSLNEETL